MGPGDCALAHFYFGVLDGLSNLITNQGETIMAGKGLGLDGKLKVQSKIKQ